MMSENESGVRQKHHKKEGAIRYNIKLLGLGADHVEKSFFIEAWMIQSLITMPYLMMNAFCWGLFFWFQTRTMSF